VSDVDRLLSEYIAEHQAGGRAEPREYLERVEGADREELAELIDAYLARSPGAAWDPEAFRGSAAARLSESIERSLAGQSGLWPVLLPRLRDRVQLKRSDLVARLAETLGVADSVDKVDGYYHEMEQGLLPSHGVSSRVLDGIGGLVGASGEFLRRAGEPFGAGTGRAEGPVFARTATPDAEYDGTTTRDEQRSAEPTDDWDQVDRLFRGGTAE
jgi:hypothetical protein